MVGKSAETVAVHEFFELAVVGDRRYGLTNCCQLSMRIVKIRKMLVGRIHVFISELVRDVDIANTIQCQGHVRRSIAVRIGRIPFHIARRTGIFRPRSTIKKIDLDAKFFIIDKKEILFYLSKENDKEDIAVWLNSEFFSQAFASLFDKVLGK